MGQPSGSFRPITPLDQEVDLRLGIVPNFFRLASDEDAVAQNLWGFAKFSYIDNPLPSLFKERLFVYLSRFCQVRYCLARHVGFLLGLGNPSGDPSCSPETLQQVIRLVQQPLAKGSDLQPKVDLLLQLPQPITESLEPESATETAVFACATHVFLQSPQAAESLTALRKAFDPSQLQYLLTFLAFVRTAHFWTQVHPELKLEEDISQLLAVQEALAQCVLGDPDGACETSEVMQEELALLRREQEQAELLRTTLACIADAVITTDLSNRITILNAVAAALTGWTPEEATGQSVDTVFQIVEEAGLDNTSQEILIAKEGERRAIDHTIAPLIDAQGKVAGNVIVFRDVTKQRADALALRDARSRLQSTLAAGEIGTWDWDIANDRVFADQNLASIFEITQSQASGERLEFFVNSIHPDDKLRVTESIQQSLASGESFEQEYRLLTPGGDQRWVIARGRVERNDEEIAVRLSGVVIDITERMKSQQELARITADLERQRRMYETALSNTADNNYVFDLAGRITFANSALLQLWQAKWEDVVNRNFYDLNYPRELADKLHRQIQQVIDTKKSLRDETSYTGVAGERRYEYILVPVMGADGRVEAVAGSTRDITERKQLEENLRQLAADLSEANRRKDEFLATLAHELRNPLAPIRNGLEILKFETDPATIEDIRSTMERQTQQLIALVDDLLDVARITQGKLELRKYRVALAEVIQTAVEASSVIMEEAGHSLSVSIPPQPIFLEADPHRLTQVISNLLNNAAKYTPEGGQIWLNVNEQSETVSVSVIDSGIGIPLEKQQSIFEMFTQIDQPLEKGYVGLGIGLTLVKTLVHMHGGEIEVQSDGNNRGSEFRVHLPVLHASATVPSQPAEPVETPKPRRRVLIVDDNHAAAKTLSLVVKMLGSDVRTAGDGEEAIQVASEYLPDIILMDLGMPKMNGYEAARHIRDQHWGKEMLLVALTGWGQSEDRQRTQEAGFNQHLVKPAEPADLQKLLSM